VEPPALIRLQMRLLEELFEPRTLRDPHQRHPAAQRWQLCLRILQQGGVIRWPEQKAELPLIARMVLDSTSFVEISGGDLRTLSLGDLAGYGDAAVQRKIQTRLGDASQFEDLMVEVSIAAWHQREGHTVIPSEASGWPDLRIDIESLELPILLECKRTNSTTGRGVKKDITKANKQIKEVGISSHGVAFLDITAAVPQQTVLSDATPLEVLEILERVRAALSGPKHRSVGRAIVVWDDAGILGEPPGPTTVFLRRCFANIDHGPDPNVRVLPATAPTFRGSTTVFAMEWDTSAIGIDRIVPSDLMKECNQWFSFSDNELIDAFVNRNKWQPIALGDNEKLFLFMGVSTHHGKRTLILAFAGRNDSALNLQFALRLPERYIERTDLLTPLESVEVVTSDYGLDLTIGELTARFFPHHRVALIDQGGLSSLAIIHNPEQHAVLQSMLVKVIASEQGVVAECAFAFALDRTRLLADLNASPFDVSS